MNPRRIVPAALVVVFLGMSLMQLAPKSLGTLSPGTPRPIDQMFGTNIHLPWDWGVSDSLPLLNQANATWIRSDFWWSILEPTNDSWGMDISSREGTVNSLQFLDGFVANTSTNGTKVLALLSYGTEWACPPFTDERGTHYSTYPYNVADFADYARFVVQRWKGNSSMGYYEIYNEPNINSYWRSNITTVRQFANLTIAAAQAIKAEDPTAKVIGPGLSGIGLEIPGYESSSSRYPNFLQDWYDAVQTYTGGHFKDLFDGFACHPYGDVNHYYPFLLDLLTQWVDARSAADGKQYLKLVSETGATAADLGTDYHIQGQINAKMMVFSAAYDFDVHIQYEFFDGNTPTLAEIANGKEGLDGERTFGLVESDFATRKLGYFAYAAVAGTLVNGTLLPGWVNLALDQRNSITAFAFVTRDHQVALAYWASTKLLDTFYLTLDTSGAIDALTLYRPATNYSAEALSPSGAALALPLSEDLHVVTIKNVTTVQAISGVFAPLSYVVYVAPLGLLAIVVVAVRRSNSHISKNHSGSEKPKKLKNKQ